jgi:micrococcal nuclease
MTGPVLAVWVATLVSCYDGDTCRMDVEVWSGLIVQAQVRLRGIDAPEIFGKCAIERALAKAARDALDAQLAAAEVITLTRVEADKYGGRVLADVAVEGRTVAEVLLENGLARPYSGGARQGWCG